MLVNENHAYFYTWLTKSSMSVFLFQGNIVTCGVLGGYFVVLAVNAYTYTSLSYITLDILKRLLNNEFSRAFISVPLQSIGETHYQSSTLYSWQNMNNCIHIRNIIIRNNTKWDQWSLVPLLWCGSCCLSSAVGVKESIIGNALSGWVDSYSHVGQHRHLLVDLLELHSYNSLHMYQMS